MTSCAAQFHVDKYRKLGARKVKELTTSDIASLRNVYKNTRLMNWIEYDSDYSKDPCFVQIRQGDGKHHGTAGKVYEMSVVSTWSQTGHWLKETVADWVGHPCYDSMKEAYAIVESVLGPGFDR